MRGKIKRIWFGLALICAIGLISLLRFERSSLPSMSVTSPSGQPVISDPKPVIRYQVYSLPQGEVHSLQIPADHSGSIEIALSSTLDLVEEIARQQEAVAAINGGFFDPQNQKTTSYLFDEGELVADPSQNERLVGNPELAAVLDQILNRTEFRRLACGHTTRYQIALRQTSVPPNCRLVDALGAGPQLLPQLLTEQEGFVEQVDGQIVRDALGSTQPNARSAIGITSTGDVVWAMIAQQPDIPLASGFSLQEMANFMETLGAEQAMNLDGGSSATFYYAGKTVYGKVNSIGEEVKRPVKSVLLLRGIS